jgi:lytic murein transglycosylase B
VALSSLSAALPAAARWQTLPRDARDTLFQLAVIGWTVLPHLLHLPWWCTAMVAGILVWRGRLAVLNAPLPGRWIVAATLALAAALTLWTERTLLGKEAGVTMLVVLMALKTLELRARRDALVIFFLGFFLVLTHFLYSQSLFTALATMVSVAGLLTALVLAHMPVGKPPLWQAAKVALRATLFALPVMLVLFLFFPRLAPLWGLPQDAGGKTGLSGTLRMGAVAELAGDDSIAMRIQFDGPTPPPQALYFRGPVLSDFDGQEWTRLRPSFGPEQRMRHELRTLGAALPYTVTVEPSRLPFLPLLEATPDRAYAAPVAEAYVFTLGHDLQWTADRPVTERVRMEVQAYPLFRYGPRAATLPLRDQVRLPAGYNPRTLAWAASLRATPEFAQADGTTLVNALLAYIRRGGFSYTLAPGTYGRDAVDEFWFDRKLGFCEHYAASLVVLLRALDVPARIVTGYQGADPVPVDGWTIVRQSHAHAWAEYWQSGVGWIRVDPTAAVAPERIDASRNLVPPPNLMEQAIGNVNPALLKRLRAMWEALDNRWNQWVLNYSRGNQFDLLKKLGFRSPSWVELAYLLLGLLCLAALGGALWAWWDRVRQDPWQKLQARIREQLARVGVMVPAHAPPRERAQALRRVLGPSGEALAVQLEALEAARYAPGGRREVPRHWWPAFARAAAALPSVARGVALAATVALLALVPGESAWAQKPTKKPPQPAPAPAAQAYGERADVMAFADDIAQRNGWDAAWVRSQLAQARLVPQVRSLIMPPPAGTARNWGAYRARFVEPQRIAAGLAFWRANEPLLARAEQRFGVPAEIVVGIIGVETFYGRIMGSFRVIDALATLSFDFPPGRRDRTAFFRDELEALLRLVQREGSDAQALRGSFAGAMGLPQFMPSSVNRYAVDFDGDGHIDLHRNAADVIGSVANYLAQFGWQPGMPTHYTVQAPVDVTERAALVVPDIVPSFSAEQMVARGAELSPAGRAHMGPLALVELQNGDAAPSYVAGTQNFYAVTRYNWSSYYALAVIDLGAAVRRAFESAR